MAIEYLAEAGEDKGKSYQEDTGEFRDTLERFQFTGWIRKRFSAPVSPEEFTAWLKEREAKRRV